MFDVLVQPMFSEIQLLSLSIVAATASRDLLLPRLISGEIDVDRLDIVVPVGSLKAPQTSANFYFDLNLNAAGPTGDTFSTSFAQVLKVFGKGKLSNLPADLQDARFFFKQWVLAFVKYLTVGDQNPVPALSSIVINSDDLFFDSIGAGQDPVTA